MNRSWLLVLLLSGCVPRTDYDAKAKEADQARHEADVAKQQAAQLQSQLNADNAATADLKNALGLAQSQAMTDEQKSQLEEGKRAIEEARERGKLLEDLQAKFKKMIDAGHLKITTRHGRAVLQLHNDVLFDPGEADIKPAGKQTLAEVAATLRGVGGKRFQVAGHTDTEALTGATKKKYPTNWELSSARAIAVVKLLVQNGVDPNVLSAAGYGPYDPIASNANAEGQSHNRRIEITLVPHVALPPAGQAAKTP
jgi:chemotaxis protein MotB